RGVPSQHRPCEGRDAFPEPDGTSDITNTASSHSAATGGGRWSNGCQASRRKFIERGGEHDTCRDNHFGSVGYRQIDPSTGWISSDVCWSFADCSCSCAWVDARLIFGSSADCRQSECGYPGRRGEVANAIRPGCDARLNAASTTPRSDRM